MASDISHLKTITCLVPLNYLPIFQKTIKENKNLKNKGDLKIFTETNKQEMSEGLSNIAEITKKPDSYNEITTVNEESIVEKIDSYQNEMATVTITDEETNYQYKFSMVNDYKSGQLLLINQKKQVCGLVEDWEDAEDVIPEDFKNKDNIVLNPEDNNELLSFRIQRNTRLAKRVYREYQFLEDHDNLQRTNLVDINYCY